VGYAGSVILAVQLADHFNGEIISADSRQVYRGMNIGTGKDLNEYIINGKSILYHLIDVKEPTEEFSLFEFKELFQKERPIQFSRSHTILLSLEYGFVSQKNSKLNS
jgi:tRNA A37 N6-isopentenylltransferase MiaA